MNLGKADCAFNLAVSHFRFANPSEVMRNDAKFAFGGSMDFSKFANIFKEAYQGRAASLEGSTPARKQHLENDYEQQIKTHKIYSDH